ncbi:low molecular weight protein-tyrosine-phosphatase [Sediminibacillus massiliensis]|uniref:low molecular weight protein-tyrosine-phosphatase n=1 Tax=Sediminibacillus massiliensis TaxID=1926277 RepID=UPI0009882EF0|nr:low molecular weight protein-tyrosine-phosphatase [Sediminibacillus massiliensis]
MIKVLFVCLGNLCRSPMAEAIFRDMVKKQGLENKIAIDSAGIGHWHIGELPHEGTRKQLDQVSISYEGITARKIVEEDWDNFNYIIAMDENNMEDLRIIREADDKMVVAKMMDFVKDAEETNIPDPYFSNNFNHVFQLIEQGCKGLLERIKLSHQL